MDAFLPRYAITNAMTTGLAAIERARGFLEAASLSDAWVERMGRRAVFLEAHHTTHIEGTRLTLGEAETLWEGGTVPQADPDDVRELLNYREAFDLVGGHLGDGAPITEGLIREIHRRLVQGVRGGEGEPGAYRRVQNYVVNSGTGEVVYTPPPPGDVPACMHGLVRWLENPGDIHPVLVAGIAQFQLVHIHPFVDGNGRTSRLLSTLCLYRAGYDFKRLFTISEFYDRDRAAFYGAIQRVRESGMDLSGWLAYFVAGLATQLEEVKACGRAAVAADALAAEHSLNARQRLALGHLIERRRLDIQGFGRLCPEVGRRTLQRDLAGLEAAGLVCRRGGTNRLHYVLRLGDGRDG